MPTQTDMREGTLATVDTFGKLTGDGAGGTLQDSTVPTWAHSIKQLAVCAGVDGAAGSGCIMVKLAGATMHGDQIFCVAGHGNIGTTVGCAMATTIYAVDIPVQPGKALEIYGAYAGGDTGTPELGVSVTYSDQPGRHAYVSRQGTLATVDVWATISTENGATVVNDHITQGQKIEQVWVAVGIVPTTQEPVAHYARIQGVGGCIEGNEHTFCAPSFTVSDGTLADTIMSGAHVYDVDIACRPGTVRIQGVKSGAASTGTPELGVTLAYLV